MCWTPAKMLLLADVDEYIFTNAVVCIVMDFSKAIDIGGSSQSSTDMEYEPKTTTGSRTYWETALNKWSSRAPPQTASQSPLGYLRALFLTPSCFCCLLITLVLTSVQTSDCLPMNDTIIYRAGDAPRDAVHLQKDLNRLQEWSHSNQMEIHPDKFKHLMVTRARTPIISQYTIYGTTLEMVENIKYLGGSFAKDLRWKTQCGNVTCATLSFLQRNLWVTSVATKSLAYTTFVRPQRICLPSMASSHSAWHIEMIQCTAARWMQG